MKNSFLLLSGALSLMVFASCSKQSMNQKPNDHKHNVESLAQNSNPATKHWEDAIEDCMTPAINCLPDVVVTAPKKADLMHVIQTDGSANGIATFFNTTEGIALAGDLGMDASDLGNLQSGNYNVITKASGSTSGLDYYFFGPATNLNRSNAEYIIPITEE